MTRLLLLADGPAMDYRVLRAAAATGAKVFVLGEPRAKLLAASRDCAGFVTAPQRFDAPDRGVMIREINRLADELDIDMIVPGDPVTSHFLVYARAELLAPAFPGPDPATYELLNDKWRFTEFTRTLGFTCPRTRLFPDRRTLSELMARRVLPVPSIVKPVAGSGGIGVIKLEAETLEAKLQTIDYEPVLWQAFIDGLDVDVNIYCEAGELLSFIAYRRERGVYHFFDSPAMRAQLETLAARLNLTGIYNFDVVTDANLENVHWLECNPRVFFTIDVLSFVGLNYIAPGLPGASRETTRRTHERGLRAIEGRRLRKWNALARDAVRLGPVSAQDFAYLAHNLADPAPAMGALAESKGGGWMQRLDRAAAAARRLAQEWFAGSPVLAGD